MSDPNKDVFSAASTTAGQIMEVCLQDSLQHDWEAADHAPQGGSFFIGQHVGANAEISLQPDVVPVRPLGLLGLLQRAHEVRRMVAATEPRYDRQPQPAQIKGKADFPRKGRVKAFLSHRHAQTGTTGSKPR